MKPWPGAVEAIPSSAFSRVKIATALCLSVSTYTMRGLGRNMPRTLGSWGRKGWVRTLRSSACFCSLHTHTHRPFPKAKARGLAARCPAAKEEDRLDLVT